MKMIVDLTISAPIPQYLRCAVLSFLLFLSSTDVVDAQNDIAESRIYSGKVVLCGTQHLSDPLRRIEVLDPDSLKLQEICVLENELPLALRVSPDGTYLAVTAVPRDEDTDQVHLILVDSQGHVRKIAEDAMIVAWSPDATRLLVREGKKYEWSNSIVELDTGRKEALPVPMTDAVMDWSSNGLLLSVMAGNPERIFEQRPDEFYPRRQLYLYDLKKRSTKPAITHTDEDCIKGMFSRDGSRLAYSRRTYDSARPVELGEIYHMESGTHRTLLDFTALGVRPNQNPLWSSDGKQLLWQVTREVADEVQFELWFLAADGSARRRVTATQLGMDSLGVVDWR